MIRRNQIPNHSPASTSPPTLGALSPVPFVVASEKEIAAGAVLSLTIVWMEPVVSEGEGTSTPKEMSSSAFPVSTEIQILGSCSCKDPWLFKNPTARYSVSPAEASSPVTSSKRLLSPAVTSVLARKLPSDALG